MWGEAPLKRGWKLARKPASVGVRVSFLGVDRKAENETEKDPVELLGMEALSVSTVPCLWEQISASLS